MNTKKYTKNGQILSLNQIHIYHEDGSITINISEKTALENGWEVYVEPEVKQLQNFAVEVCNMSTTIDNETALGMKEYFNEWETYVGKSLEVGRIVKYNGLLYRVRQKISNVQTGQEPGLSTASIYEVIELTATGTIENPISYNPPMEVFVDKYYTQRGILYICTRDSGQPLTHNLSELIGHYVELVSTDSDFTENSDGSDYYNSDSDILVDEGSDIEIGSSEVGGSDSDTETSEPVAEEGSIDNPIEYTPPMEVFANKYYVQGGVKYICTRDSGTKLTHDLSALVGHYFNVVE